MPPQLKRLIPLFAIFIGLFLLARYLLVPDTFGEYGHYRGASLEDNAAKPAHYAGGETCSMCHDDKAAELMEDKHKSLSCEVCHGPGMDHANAPDEHQLAEPADRQHCGMCHDVHPGKKAILQVDLEEHFPDIECITCHNPHKPWEVNIPDNPEESF